MLNRSILVGRLTADPVVKTVGEHLVATMTIAVDRDRKGKDGEKETDFFNLVAWRQPAQFAQSYLGKGRLISVEGRLQNRNWIAEDGTKRYATEIVVDNISGLDRKPEGDDRPAAPTTRAEARQSYEKQGEQRTLAGEDIDDPFSDG